jgi:hypothetical protein
MVERTEDFGGLRFLVRGRADADQAAAGAEEGRECSPFPAVGRMPRAHEDPSENEVRAPSGPRWKDGA